MYVNNAHENAINLLKSGDLNESLVLIDACISDFPDNPILFSDRGTIYLHLNNKNAALADMNRAVELQPDYAYRYASRAFVKDHFGDTESAITDYEIAVQLDPDDAIAMNNLGVLMEKLGYKEAAKRKYDTADALAAKTPSLKQKLSELENGEPKNHPEGIELQAKKLDTKSAATSKNESTSIIVKDVFTKKSVFKEFLTFIKNGFKLKQND
jgi:tetratricopeptide (TPR) repeat protein